MVGERGDQALRRYPQSWDVKILKMLKEADPDGQFWQEKLSEDRGAPYGEFRGKNLLYVAQSIEDIAVRADSSPDEVVAALGRIRETLAAARAKRPRPHLDDKILTAWNGLMIAAFARAGRVLAGRASAERYVGAAQRAATFIKQRLWRPDASRLAG